MKKRGIVALEENTAEIKAKIKKVSARNFTNKSSSLPKIFEAVRVAMRAQYERKKSRMRELERIVVERANEVRGELVKHFKAEKRRL